MYSDTDPWGKTQCQSCKTYSASGDVSQEEYEKVKKYLINPVECQEASLEKPSTLDVEVTVPEDVKVLKDLSI